MPYPAGVRTDRSRGREGPGELDFSWREKEFSSAYASKAPALFASRSAIERAVIISGEEIDLESLPPKVREGAKTTNAPEKDDSHPTLDELEKQYVMEILRSVRDDKSEAANILGIDLSTLYRKLKRYDLA